MSKILKEGDSAPHFCRTDVLGNKIDFSQYNEKLVLLVFLRYAGCPWCNLALHRLSLESKLLAKYNCEVIAFVQSNEESIIKNIYNRHKVQPPFPVIADPDREIYDLYGVPSSVLATGKRLISHIPYWLESVYSYGFKQTQIDGDLFLVPAMFLVDTTHYEILKVEQGASFYDHETFTNIYVPLLTRHSFGPQSFY